MKAELAPFLAEAMRAEFYFLDIQLQASGESWDKAANGVITKLDVALSGPKDSGVEYSLPEVHLIDLQLRALGWDFREESRVAFLQRVGKVLRDADIRFGRD